MTVQGQIPIAAVVGPTASGKTGLAVALAKKLGGEVVSADSMQIYQGMDIGTAKPTAEEMGGVPHHLMGFVDPCQAFSVAQYLPLARQCVSDIHARGHLPIVAGGTGLYVSALLGNLQFEQEQQDDGLRRHLEQRMEQEGAQALLNELASFDPQTAARLHPNNKGRIIRAIEVYRRTGITMTEHLVRSRAQPSPYRAGVIGLNFRNRQELYRRIDARVDDMMQRGLAQEAAAVLSGSCGKTAGNAIGYKELAPWMEGRCTLEEAVAQIKQSTRRYAKRQLTWFRRMEQVRWIYVDECSSPEDMLRQAIAFLRQDGVIAG
ncbi:MAG TPA: tRNA (adenosine(37)-N6)-dimethylallyltransferase MiaA [Candidatus Gallacutalibacter stercoravium]|nr:tRNA (adenosine(37)-N6)-dimethylallyltransferase MiaA [Candidatus Gallacutalibacter stercoravium]